MTTTTAPRKTGASFQFIEDRSRRTVCFGPKEIKATFGVAVPPPIVPALFSESVIERALQMDCAFVQQISEVEGKSLTLQHLYESRGNKDALGEKFLYDIVWYQHEPLFTTHTPRPGLFIKGRSVVPKDSGETFVEESLVAANFVEKLFGEELPEQYGVAIEELRAGTERLDQICRGHWQEGARQCVALSFSRFFRESPVEVLYRVLLGQKVNRERLFKHIYTRTNSLSARGPIMAVGFADVGGARLRCWKPTVAYDDVGFSFSCSGELEPSP